VRVNFDYCPTLPHNIQMPLISPLQKPEEFFLIDFLKIIFV